MQAERHGNTTDSAFIIMMIESFAILKYLSNFQLYKNFYSKFQLFLVNKLVKNIMHCIIRRNFAC